MALYNEQKIKSDLAGHILARLYLIYGNEAYLKKHYISKITSEAVSKGNEFFNLHIFDGQESNSFSLAFETAQNLPVMGGKNCVVVNDMPLDKLTKDEQSAFDAQIADLPEDTVMIFAMNEIEVFPKFDSWKAIIDKFSKYGIAVALDKRAESSVVNLLIAGAKKRGVSLDAQTAQYLIDTCSNDLNILLNELDKLTAFVEKGSITKDIIDEISVRSTQAIVFEIADCILKHNTSRGYDILHQLIKQKTPAPIISASIATAFSDIYRVKIAKLYNRRPYELTQFFNYSGSKTFRLDNASKYAAILSRKQICLCLDAIKQADTALKNTGGDESIILDRLIAKLAVSVC